MKTRPWQIKLLTLALLCVPIIEGFIAHRAWQRWHALPPADLLLTSGGLALGSLIAAIGIWRVQLWGYFVMVAFGLIITSVDLFHIISRHGDLNPWDFFDIPFVLTAIAVLSVKRVREPYFNPKLRWWEPAARHPVHLNACFVVNEKKIQAPLLDLSSSGCFADLNGEVKQGDILEMRLQFETFTINSPAKIIRLSKNPKGAGVMFFDTPKEHRTALKKLMVRLSKNYKKAA